MAGASAVMLASAPNLNGYELYEDIYNDLEAFMKRKGYETLADFRGLAHKRIAEREAQKKQIIHEVVLPHRTKTRCTACGNCVMACAYDAIEMGESKPEFITENCHGCGLCVSVCPAKAIDQNYFGA